MKKRFWLSLSGLLVLFSLFLHADFAPVQAAGGPVRVSIASDGVQGDKLSAHPSISADGRFVAFHSDATNLVSGDTNAKSDVFVHDRFMGTTTRVSIASDGVQGNGYSNYPEISADGRFVAFQSDASNLVSGDTNARTDIFVHDRQTGSTTRVSVASDGTQGNGNSGGVSYPEDPNSPSISADGRYVAFNSVANNLVSGDTGWWDIFVHDRQTGTTTLVSVASDGTQGNGFSFDPSISADGRYVAFYSDAENLVSGDANKCEDIFVHDLQTGTTTRVSLSYTGADADSSSFSPSISADGRYVAFSSGASNLVTSDTNGAWDVFVYDQFTSATTRISVANDGAQGKGTSKFPSISAGGRYVAFNSSAKNLDNGDTNGYFDIFIHDQLTGTTTRVSLTYTGAQGNGDAKEYPSISTDGRFVAFSSAASNLISGDTNGQGDIFVFVPPAAAPTLVSPANSSTVTTWTPTYTWVDNTEATYFKLYAGKPDYSIIYASWYTRAQANCDGSTCHVTPDAVITAGQNKWCVKSYNASGGTWSGWWNFNSPTNTAAAPMLDSPAQDEALSTWTPTYTWNDDANATHYKLWVGKSDGRQTFAQWYTRAQANCDGAHCSITPEGIVNPGKNRWYVKAYNPNGGAWSSPVNFNQDNLLLSPAHGGTVSDSKPTYTWVDISTATGFTIWIGLPDGTRQFYLYYSRADAHCDGSTCWVIPDFTLITGRYGWSIVFSTSSGDRFSDQAIFKRP